MSEIQQKSSESSVADELRQVVQIALRRGMTRTAIARRARISRSQLSRLMKGTTPTVRTLESIARAVGGRVAVCMPMAPDANPASVLKALNVGMI